MELDSLAIRHAELPLCQLSIGHREFNRGCVRVAKVRGDLLHVDHHLKIHQICLILSDSSSGHIEHIGLIVSQLCRGSGNFTFDSVKRAVGVRDKLNEIINRRLLGIGILLESVIRVFDLIETVLERLNIFRTELFDSEFENSRLVLKVGNLVLEAGDVVHELLKLLILAHVDRLLRGKVVLVGLVGVAQVRDIGHELGEGRGGRVEDVLLGGHLIGKRLDLSHQLHQLLINRVPHVHVHDGVSVLVSSAVWRELEIPGILRHVLDLDVNGEGRECQKCDACEGFHHLLQRVDRSFRNCF